jgi:hypothetical protein
MIMNWKEPDWKQDRPTDAEIRWMWRSVALSSVDSPPDTEPYLAELRRVNVNGSVIFGLFQIEGNESLDWFASRNRWDEVNFFRRLLSHPSVRQRWPDLVEKIRDEQFSDFEWGSSLTLDSELARSLLKGRLWRYLPGGARSVLGFPPCRNRMYSIWSW